MVSQYHCHIESLETTESGMMHRTTGPGQIFFPTSECQPFLRRSNDCESHPTTRCELLIFAAVAGDQIGLPLSGIP